MEPQQKTALITGANKGIGFEIARQLGLAGFRVIVLIPTCLTADNTTASAFSPENIRITVETRDRMDNRTYRDGRPGYVFKFQMSAM